MESIISIKNLNFSYNTPYPKKDRIVPDGNGSSGYFSGNTINNFNLEILEGSFVSILGPNGSGKSTLISLISGVLKGYTGEIEISGKNILKMNSKEIARLVAVVPQYTSPAFDFSVYDLILMGRYPYISRYGTEKSADFEVVENVMEQAKVTGLKNKKFNELSGGEKQRVAIAQALVQETPVLLLDEPTSHLDINFQIELMELFRRLNTVENKTILGVFHDINLAVSFAESAVFMKNGSVYTKGRIDGTVNRENIRAAFGSDVYVGKNPVTGKIYVSPYFSGIDFAEKKDVTAPEGRLKKIHVIGGGGEASPVLNYLNASGYQVTCGVVNNFDNDLDTAIHLGIAYVSEAPFSPISLYSQNKNMEYIRQSDIVILPPVAFGHGNFPNLIVVKEALDIGKKVIIITGSNIKDRDYTGGKASELYEKIIRKGVITVESINQLKNLI